MGLADKLVSKIFLGIKERKRYKERRKMRQDNTFAKYEFEQAQRRYGKNDYKKYI